MTKYRPSNGTEGMMFMERWCQRCTCEAMQLEGEGDSCPILADTMVYAVDEPGYPEQWQVGDDGQPLCTEFRPELTPEKRAAEEHAAREEAGQMTLFAEREA